MRKRSVFVIVFTLFWLIVFLPSIVLMLWLADENVEGAGQGEAAAYETNGPDGPIVASREQNETADHRAAWGERQVKKSGPARRQVREQPIGGPDEKFVLVIMAVMGPLLAAVSYILAHVTAVGERPTKRGRLVPVFAEDGSTVVRILNVGDSWVRLIAVGWARDQTVPWHRIKIVSRLVPKGGENGLEFAFDTSRIGDGDRFSVLLRYEDAYGWVWHAWRVFRMTPSRRVVEVEDGERQGSRYWWRQHLAFLR